jgi:hypothetical protein
MATQAQQEPIAVYRQALLSNKREEAVVQSRTFFSPLFFSGGLDGAIVPRRLTAARRCPPCVLEALPLARRVLSVSEVGFFAVQAKLKELRVKYDKTEDDLKVGG